MSKLFPSPEEVSRVREAYPSGCRVELVSMDDPYSVIPPGEQGTVDHVDDTGTVFVAWDSGSHLGAVWGVDEIKRVKHMRFKRKGYGRIYTSSEENIQKIRDIIREMNKFEYDYLPDDLIAVYFGIDEPVYNGKFYDFDLNELSERCQREGIPYRAVIAEDEFGVDGSDNAGMVVGAGEVVI